MIRLPQIGRMQKDAQPTFSIHDSLAQHYAAMNIRIPADRECVAHRMELLQPRAPFSSPLFRVNYYSIVMVRSGNGFTVIDGERYPIGAGSIFFSNPGHIKGYGTHEPTTGVVIGFSEEFLKRHTQETTLAECSFLFAEVAAPKRLGASETKEFGDLASRMLEEFEGDSRHRDTVMGSLLTILLLKMKERFWADYDPRHESNGGSEIVRVFRRNLEEHFRDLAAGSANGMYQVQDFAAAQLLHPNYFSAVIKRKTGKMVKTWIAEKAISEAKALLVRSRAPVQRIAYQLGFRDAAHFSRFFKHHTGTSPTEFRRRS